MQYSHTVLNVHHCLFFILWSITVAVTVAFLLLCNKRKLIKRCSKWARFCSSCCAKNILASRRTSFHGAPQKTCIPFHYKQEIHSSRKTPCRGYTSSVIALMSAAHNESLKCERLKMQKDRRRPDTCHPFHPEVFAPHTHTHTHAQTLPLIFMKFYISA